MERDAEQTPPLVAAPRHLRRRRFRAEISDPLLVPDAVPFKTLRGEDHLDQPTTRPASTSGQNGLSYRRKRAVALYAVIFVSFSVPVLALALVFAG